MSHLESFCLMNTSMLVNRATPLIKPRHEPINSDKMTLSEVEVSDASFKFSLDAEAFCVLLNLA